MLSEKLVAGGKDSLRVASYSAEIEDEQLVDHVHWQPWTFHCGTFIGLILSTGGFIAVLGLLQWYEHVYGAIYFTSGASFTAFQTFTFRYLPTILIVLYGLCWSWVDLDVKRLEPWYQLGRPTGCTAGESILLDYPADFLPLIPFKAAKQRYVRRAGWYDQQH